MKTDTYNILLKIVEENGAGFISLLDPDKLEINGIESSIALLKENGVDAVLVGGSLLLKKNFDEFIRGIKKAAEELPVILFPGTIYQISKFADAILYLSVISGRNPAHLIENHVLAAPIIWQAQIEPISCAYMLVESGEMTSAEFMSNSRPLPRNKPDIALAHALAAEYLGFKTIYLEAGSGAQLSVPDEIVSVVSNLVSIPVMVGGGIRSPEEANEKVRAGASFVVIGNYFEDSRNYNQIGEFADAIHCKQV